MSTSPQAGTGRCPRCDGELRWKPGRIIAAQLAFWAAVALLFAALWGSSEAREAYALAAALAFGAWWMLRARWRYCDACTLSCD